FPSCLLSLRVKLSGRKDSDPGVPFHATASSSSSPDDSSRNLDDSSWKLRERARYPSPLRVVRVCGSTAHPPPFAFILRTVGDALGGWLDLLDGLDEVERCVSTAWVAGQAVGIPEDERNEALRRALVVRAVGGSPQREVSLDEDAVARLADELDSAA